MKTFIYLIVFILLSAGALLMFDIKPKKRNKKISISKASVNDKKKDVDEKFARLGIWEKTLVAIKTTASMSGVTVNVFWFMVAISGFIGFGLGRFLFYDTMLASVTALILLPRDRRKFCVKVNRIHPFRQVLDI